MDGSGNGGPGGASAHHHNNDGDLSDFSDGGGGAGGGGDDDFNPRASSRGSSSSNTNRERSVSGVSGGGGGSGDQKQPKPLNRIDPIKLKNTQIKKKDGTISSSSSAVRSKTLDNFADVTKKVRINLIYVYLQNIVRFLETGFILILTKNIKLESF